jgi:hypothetical protein
MGWSADSTDITADSTYATADGSDTEPLSYLSLVTSEHNKKPKFMAMLGALTAGISSITAAIQSMPAAFDLDNAVGAQLDVLGLWIGQARVIANVLIFGFFGFADDEAALPFGELTNLSIGGRFYELGEDYEGSTILSDAEYVTILKARIVRNQSPGTLSALEEALIYIFGTPASVADNGTMDLALTVAAPITQTDQTLLNTLDLLPRPAGVRIGSITYAP